MVTALLWHCVVGDGKAQPSEPMLSTTTRNPLEHYKTLAGCSGAVSATLITTRNPLEHYETLAGCSGADLYSSCRKTRDCGRGVF